MMERNNDRNEGVGANAIIQSVERAIAAGELVPGARLPTVRALARRLKLSPTTVSSAYRALALRGMVAAGGRRGTVVSAAPPLASHASITIPPGVRNLLTGNPDPALLPRLSRLPEPDAPRLYGESINLPELVALASQAFAADGLPPGPVAIVSGTLDGVERALTAHLRPGDKIAIEDPAYSPVIDLCTALGLSIVAVRVDNSGPIPAHLEAALRAGAKAAIVTPRAQNPFGAALDSERAHELQQIIDDYPDLLVIEDDHAGLIAGAPAITLCEKGRRRWVVVRSVSKWLGPDLRLAILTGDETSVSRIEGRFALGPGWVSHILQRSVAALWTNTVADALIHRAAEAYAERRGALLEALAAHGIEAHGRSGLTVWIPVAEEQPIVQSLLAAGWAVAAGERYRLKSPPAIRVAIATMMPPEARRFADDLARALAPAARSHSA